MRNLVLASASPRRTQILNGIGVGHVAMPADIDESRRVDEVPEDYVVRMAKRKAYAVAERLADGDIAVLGADTTVTLGEQIFGKPDDENSAIEMLLQLSGQTHRVLSAVAVTCGSDARTELVESTVTLRSISLLEARRYWATGEPRDKAGGYAIQGKASAFVTAMTGSYTGIVGLPVSETLALLAAIDIVPEWLLGVERG
ncbi:MAG: Maf family protein [Pseudomonadota bacterium]